MTYRKIAQLAGVSVSTVSKALSGSDEISGETARRIRKIAEETGVIRPKYHRKRKATHIAIIVPEIVSVAYSHNVGELIDELRRYDIEPYIHICGFESERFCRIIDMLIEDNFTDGIIAITDRTYSHIMNIPMVRMDSSSIGEKCDSISNDLESSMYEAIRYLCDLGHKRIGFIGERNTVSKLRIFNSCIARMGIEVPEKNIFISSKRFEEIGKDAVKYYISQNEIPTGIIAAYDEVALGAIYAFTRNGIKIPEDVSIIGINDIPSASYASVPLTTIRTYEHEIVRLCVKMLLDRIKDPEHHMTQHIKVGCQLIIRDTTAFSGKPTKKSK